ncbi:MAG: hypothetical protein NTU44_06850 [Bacteroidetes bacterium]|nr:hypothetical protein [Bacteroidota bacterium]
MKKNAFILISLIILCVSMVTAQENRSGRGYGKVVNVGIGLGYYGYVGHSMPVIHVDYEIDVAKNFTLAPFISFYSYRKDYYYTNPHNGTSYYYHETVIPIGLKGSYYFDDLLEANSNWDFYLAGSLGFAIVRSYWDDGYTGDKEVFHHANPLYLDLHIGTEYHVNNRIGLFLDLSTGVSTIGLAIH